MEGLRRKIRREVPREPRKPKLSLWIFFGAVLGVFALGVLAKGVQTVPAGEAYVLLQFGEAKQVLYPGLHIIVPFVNDVSSISTQTEKEEATAFAASKDLQTVSTNITVNFQRYSSEAELLHLYTTFRGAEVSRVVQPFVQEAVKASTAKFTAEELITKRADVKAMIENTLKEKLHNHSMEVVAVSITDFTFSQKFDEAIEAKVTAEQEMLKEKIDLTKKQIEVQKQVAIANATRQSEILKAEGDAKAKLLRADAEAKAIEKITSQLNAAYTQYLYVQQWDGAMPKVLGSDGMMLLLDVSNETGE